MTVDEDIPGRDASHVAMCVGDIYRTDSRRVLATLIRLLGDFDTAEDRKSVV